MRRGARQLSASRNSADRLDAGGWLPLETSPRDADARERTALLLQPDETSSSIQPGAHSTVEVEVSKPGAGRHLKQRGPPPVPPEALPTTRQKRPADAITEDAGPQMNGSLERAVRVLGGDAPPLDDALAVLNQARDLELAADNEMSALAAELTQVLTPVKPLSPVARTTAESDRGARDQRQMPAWFDGTASSACSSLLISVPTTLLLLLGGTGCCYSFWLKARCDDQLQKVGGSVAMEAGVGFAVFWVCMIYGHLDGRQLIRPGGPLKRLAQTSANDVASERVDTLTRVAWLYAILGLAISMWFVALAVGIVGLLSEGSTSAYPRHMLTQAAVEFFPPQVGCEADGVSAADVRRAYWLGLLHAVGGCILVWRHTALAISAVLGGMLGVDAIRGIRCHVTRGALDIWSHRQLSTLEKQQWRDVVGTCLATRFNDEMWNALLVLPTVRLTRSTLPTLSAWSPVISSTAVGASALVVGITPFVLATNNILAIFLPLCAILIPTLQVLPMLQISSECNALRTALNDILLECHPYVDVDEDENGVDLDNARDRNVRRVSGLLDHLERLNLGRGPGVVGCSGVLLTKRLYVSFLASLVVVVTGLAVGSTY